MIFAECIPHFPMGYFPERVDVRCKIVWSYDLHNMLPHTGVQGMLVAAVSAGIVAIPAILAFWSINGLCHMTIGLCAESAPLFYCLSLASMIAQIIALAHVAKMNVSLC